LIAEDTMPNLNARLKPLLPWLIAFGVIAAIVITAYVRWHGQPSQVPPAGRSGTAPGAAMPVQAVAAKQGDINVYLTGLGTVTPVRTVTVRSRVDGQLMQVLYKEGQMVKAGDLLAEIDPRPFQVQLTQAEGQMARDQALLGNARIDLDRYRKLLAEDSIQKQLVDTQEALVKQYEGTVKMDQGMVDNARLQLVYARITAPVSGRVGLRQVDPGNIVHAADANGIVVITQLQPITVVFSIPQDSLPAVMKRAHGGEQLPVDAFDRDQKTKLASGTLASVDNQIDTTTGTVKLKAQFTNEDGGLFPNQFVNVRLKVDTLHDVTVVPVASIQRGSPGTFVYVVKPDLTSTLRIVKPGVTEGDMTSVDSGVAPGELVVTDGADRLREGSKVELPSAAPGGGQRRGPNQKGKGGGGRKKGDG
jgi:multidrug efflux system membrane fusion protein